MPILCLDTSGGSAVALVSDGAVLAAAASADPRRHAETLAPMIEAVLTDSGTARQDLAAIAVGTGPAPFTGLRVGLVTARTLGRGLGVPVHGVSSLDLLAREAFDRLADERGEVLVTTDARRREVYWARYTPRGADDVTRVAGPAVAGPAALAAALPPTVVGAGTVLYPDQLPATAGMPVRPDPALLARIVAARLRDGTDELATVPLYLRRPDVQAPAAPRRVS